MADIIVAIIVNLVAALVLVSGVMSAVRNGVKVTVVKLVMMLCGGVGAFFLTPVVNKAIYGVEGAPELLGKIGISSGSVNSSLFMLIFLAFYAITLMVCNIVRHCLIKKLRDKKLNSLKMKRARSINPSAEKAAKRAEWKALKARNKERRRWYHKLISGFVGAIIAVVVGYVVVMPYGYIAGDVVSKHEDKAYLANGYEYTINGLIGDKVSDFLIHNEGEEEGGEVEETTPGEEETPGEETPAACEHVYADGVCTVCGEAEPVAPVEPEIPEVVE